MRELVDQLAHVTINLGVCGSVMGNLGSVAAPNYPILLVSRFVAGLVVGTYFAVAIATAVSTAPAGKRSSAVAKVAMGMNLGIVVGTPMGTFIGNNCGWRATFGSVAVVTVTAAVLVLRFVPNQPAVPGGSVGGELRVFADRQVQLAIALTAVGNIGIVTVFTYIAPLLTEVSGFPAKGVPALLLVYGAGAVIGNPLGGWLADKTLMPSLIGLLTGLAAVLVLSWMLSGNQMLMVGLVFVLGALAFAIIPGMQTRVIAAAGAAPTLAVAVNAAGFQVAAAFAGWLGGRVIDSGLGPRSIYLVGALLTATGLLIALHITRRDHRGAGAAAPFRDFRIGFRPRPDGSGARPIHRRRRT